MWLVAFIVSAAVNALALVGVAFWVISSLALRAPVRSAASLESVAVIVPQVVDAAAASAEIAAGTTEPAPAAPQPFARTSPDQVEQAPESPDFMGERNTQATSDATPAPDAPEQPSQKGRDPLWEDEVETTESRYQDGELAHDRVRRPDTPPSPAEPSNARTPPETAEPAQTDDSAEAMKRDGVTEPVPPPQEDARERLAEGPVPVERRVNDAKPEDEPKPAVPDRKAEGEKPAEPAVAEKPKPASTPASPGFRGNQTKTRLVGSITRTGRSALNVEDSMLGRYHAAVSRAVEKEWQLNCVRNRDYITPGQLTMSFVLEASGKVRSVRVVEELQVGAIPKGFTLNAINDAEIPSMPGDLKKQLDGEPLELIYRFNF